MADPLVDAIFHWTLFYMPVGSIPFIAIGDRNITAVTNGWWPMRWSGCDIVLNHNLYSCRVHSLTSIGDRESVMPMRWANAIYYSIKLWYAIRSAYIVAIGRRAFTTHNTHSKMPNAIYYRLFLIIPSAPCLYHNRKIIAPSLMTYDHYRCDMILR